MIFMHFKFIFVRNPWLRTNADTFIRVHISLVSLIMQNSMAIGQQNGTLDRCQLKKNDTKFEETRETVERC